MSTIGEIKELAKRLQLFNLARGDIDLSGASKGNLDFLHKILTKEQDLRDSARYLRLEHESRLPRKEFFADKLNSGVKWQIEHLEKLNWIDDDQNLFIIGKCGTGKTSLISHLGRKAIAADIKVSYNTIESFLYTMETKGHIHKQQQKYKYWLSCSLIIVDDMMYTGLTDEELMNFYHTIMLLNETRSIVIITNRELSSWDQNGNDSHLMQTLIERLSANSQQIRLI